jgi:hypothetical protein
MLGLVPPADSLGPGLSDVLLLSPLYINVDILYRPDGRRSFSTQDSLSKLTAAAGPYIDLLQFLCSRFKFFSFPFFGDTGDLRPGFQIFFSYSIGVASGHPITYLLCL